MILSLRLDDIHRSIVKQRPEIGRTRRRQNEQTAEPLQHSKSRIEMERNLKKVVSPLKTDQPRNSR